MAPLLSWAIVCLVALAPVRAARADDQTPPTSESPPESGHAETDLPMTSIAKEYYDRGLKLYASRQFRAAIRELEQGYAVEARPEFLFAEAQAFRLAGDCSRAVPLYQRFLEAKPSPIQIQATRLALGRCGPERSATMTAAPAPVRPAGPATVPVTATERPTWWKDAWAWSSVGVGAAALAVGTGFLVASNHARDDATSARTTNYFAFTRLMDEAEQRRTIAITSLIGGAALVATGIIRWGILRHREGAEDAVAHPRSSTTVSPASASSGLSACGSPRGAAVMWEMVY